MFGAVVATFFEYILGIRQREGSAGYNDIVISPEYIEQLNFAKGHITTPKGRVAVEYTVKDGERTCKVTVPEGMAATFITREAEEIKLTAGENTVKEKI